MIAYAFTFLVMLVVYIYVSVQKKSIINIMFFQFVGTGVILVLFNALRLAMDRQLIEVRRGDLIMLAYLWACYLGSAFIVLMKPRAHPSILSFTKARYPAIWVVALLALLFLGYWAAHAGTVLQAIANPRMFYASTRLGGGLIYFIVLPVGLFLYYVLIARIDYAHRYGLLMGAALTLLCCAFFYVFGQKSKLVSIAVIFLAVYAYKCTSIDKNRDLLVLGAGIVVAMLVIFTLYFRQQGIDVNNIMSSLAGYSDYIDNFNDLVDDLELRYLGDISVQDELYGYIPRALWPGKPELYGSLQLGLHIPRLYEWTMAKTGAPSFGPLGSLYADFGLVGVVVQTAINLMMTYLAKCHEDVIETCGFNFFDHVMLMTYCGYAVFSIPLVKLPLYQIGVTLAIYGASVIRLRSRTSYLALASKALH